MSWLKKLFQLFKSGNDDYKSDEEYIEQTQFESKNLRQQKESLRAVNAKIAYQYPKGQFRFPVIPDEPVKPVKEETHRIQRDRVRERNEEKVYTENSIKNVNRPAKEKEKEVLSFSKKTKLTAPKKGPFRPTEIPSPIYGFERPNLAAKAIIDESIEFQLDEHTDIKAEQTPIDEPAKIMNEQIENNQALAAAAEADQELEDDIIKENELAKKVIAIDQQKEKKLDRAEIADKQRERTEEQAAALSIVKEQEQEKEQEKEAVEDKTESKINRSRPHIPFNVIMLNKDKQGMANKSAPSKSKANGEITKPGIERRPQLRSEEAEKNSQDISYYVFPPRSLLTPPVIQEENSEWLSEQEQMLNSTLRNFNVRAKVVNVTQGPSVTRYEVQPEPGVKVNKITNLSDDIKLSLAARDIRIEAPIPGKHTIGIEVPNRKSRPVFISEIINSPEFKNCASPLTAVLGLDISGRPIVTDLRKMPHGLIAGATGSGKSVCINSILISLLYKADPDELKLMLIDPKMVELAPYNQIPHLVSPVITDVKAATAALKWAVEEMERRYELFAHTGVRDINRYNELAQEHKHYSDKLPFMVIIIDELADLMMMSPADVEESICRIAQKARACGIHLIIATQRPSVDVITGLIKANVPTRIAFSVSSQVDSRTIIDISGAEKLLGRGDMLFLENGSSKPVRLQGTFVSDNEIDDVVAHVRKERTPNYLFEQDELLKKAQITEDEDELFYEACEFVVEQGGASTSSLQRRFKIGYNRAARLIDMMEQQGFISGNRGSKPREVLITGEELEALQDNSTIN